MRWTSRKFWTTNFWQAVATGLVFAGKIDGSAYCLLTAGLIGIYVAGNVVASKKRVD